MDSNLFVKFRIPYFPDKSFSISFVDGFADCAYRVFLSRILRIDSGINANTTFGKALHNGLAKANEILKTGDIPCLKCPNHTVCGHDTPNKQKAFSTKIDECPFQQVMLQGYEELITEDIRNEIKKTIFENTKKNKEEAGESMDLLDSLAMPLMKDAFFVRQPRGKVLMVEEYIKGQVEGFNFGGVVDLVLELPGGKKVIFDYKSTGARPSFSSFPIRQFAPYEVMLRDKMDISGFGTIYMVKKHPPQKPRKGSRPHQYGYSYYYNLEEGRAEADRVLELLREDMIGVRVCMDNGIFLRNRGSTFCPCEVQSYCEDCGKVKQHIENYRRKSVNDQEQSTHAEGGSGSGSTGVSGSPGDHEDGPSEGTG